MEEPCPEHPVSGVRLRRLLLYDLELIRRHEQAATHRPIDSGYFALLGVFVGALVTAQFAAVKLAGLSVGPLFFVVPAGVVAYAVTFWATDVIGEIYGMRAANSAVVAGLAANAALLLTLYTGYVLPPLTPEHAQKYSVLMAAPRIVAASLIAYMVSQSHDVVAFHYWKARTNGRHLWLRNNASTIVSQFLDSLVFITLAFYGTVPNSVLLNMVVTTWLFKALIALADTPFIYVAVALLRR